MTAKKPYLIPEWPVPKHIKCFTTLRFAGCSQAPYASFNLGDHVGDRTENVLANRQKMYTDWELARPPTWLKQMHGTRVVELSDRPGENQADAVIARSVDQVCAVLTADCLPILLCNDLGCEVAAIHAGWRGLLHGIIEKTVSKLQSSTSSVTGWLGPAISSQAFEVSSNIQQEFTNKNPRNTNAFSTRNNRIYADLYQLARNQLEDLGITEIYGGNYCTFNNIDHFFSYRRQNITGRMATVITIKPT